MSVQGITTDAIISLLSLLEENFPVWEWRVNGTSVWPLVRIHIAVQMRKAIDLGEVPKQPKRRVGKSEILHRWARDNRREAFPIPRRAVVVFGRASGMVQTATGFYSPYTDPIVEILKNAGKSVLSVLRDKTNSMPFPRAIKSMYVNYLLISRIIHIIMRLARISSIRMQLPGFENVKKKVFRQSEVGLRLTRSNIKRSYETARAYRILFTPTLLITRPKGVVVNCFYAPDSFGIVWACKKLGIPCYDYQHGVQGANHYAYAEWKRLQQEDLTFLPDGFFTWDDLSTESLQRWAGKNIHVAQVGNLWHGLESRLSEQFREEIQSLRQRANGRSTVLYSLQEYVPPDWVLDAIRSDRELFWLVRAHPQHPEILEIVVKRIGLSLNFEHQLSTRLPLPVLLQIADSHVTGNSTVVMEAREYGISSVVVDPIGAEYYRQLIREGTVVEATSTEKLLNVVKRLSADKQKTAVRIKLMSHRLLRALLNESPGTSK
jgi:hypothetical protein